jgi:hypothetical protein
MAIAMTTGYSAQTEGALLCINAASDWALTCVDQLPAQIQLRADRLRRC